MLKSLEITQLKCLIGTLKIPNKTKQLWERRNQIKIKIKSLSLLLLLMLYNMVMQFTSETHCKDEYAI